MLRKCIFKWENQDHRFYDKVIEGKFYTWGCDFVEFSEGPGNCTIGIVEDLSGNRYRIYNIDSIIFNTEEE